MSSEQVLLLYRVAINGLLWKHFTSTDPVTYNISNHDYLNNHRSWVDRISTVRNWLGCLKSLESDRSDQVAFIFATAK